MLWIQQSGKRLQGCSCNTTISLLQLNWSELLLVMLYVVTFYALRLYLSDKMVSLGYNQSDIVRAVEENQCNETMATYLLLQQQYCLVGANVGVESSYSVRVGEWSTRVSMTDSFHTRTSATSVRSLVVGVERIRSTTTTTTHFMAICPGLPRWAGTRSNTHPPTVLIIIQSLSERIDQWVITHWLWLVHWVSFHTLTWSQYWLDDRKGIWTVKYPCDFSPGGGRKLKGNWLAQFHLENGGEGTSEACWLIEVLVCLPAALHFQSSEVTVRRARLVLGWVTVFGR